MSYQVLARKWRPRNFASLVGQEHVVRALTHALSENRLHHAYLFTGTRGVGKTTLARILAKALNCEQGITATPCGLCSACQEIDSGRFVDLLEVDAATNTRVDEMRQLLENAIYAPTRGRFKVYVIDEVHMLSNSAFNAMLKTLEEPPEHVKFILATTDPQKIPVTVLSRCLQFNLKQMPQAAIAGHLAHILQAEGIAHDSGALSLIARSAEGSMRDALSLLDQAIAHGSGEVQATAVSAMLGTVDSDFVGEILEALVASNAAELIRLAGELAVRSFSFEAVLQELAGLLTRIQVSQFSSGGDDGDDADQRPVKNFSARMSPEFVQLAYQIVVNGRQELPLAPDEYSGFVMTLLRLHAFRPDTVGDVVASERVRAKTINDGRAERPPAPPIRELETTVPERSVKSPDRAMVLSDWGEITARLRITGLARELAQNSELVSLTDGLCALRLSNGMAHLQMKANVDKLQGALSELLGRGVQLKIEVGQVSTETPALTESRVRREKQALARDAIENDEFVRDVIDSLDGSLIESTIKPLD